MSCSVSKITSNKADFNQNEKQLAHNYGESYDETGDDIPIIFYCMANTIHNLYLQTFL